MWDWCLQGGIILSTLHLPRLNNVVADFESREVRMSTEWKLNEDVFHSIHYLLGPCKVDLFTTQLNNQLLDLSEPEGLCLFPFSLIGRCLQKVRREGSTITIVAPLWKNQSWYLMLLELMVDFPLLLPHQEDLLRDPMGQLHPLVCQNSLRLTAWRVSGSNTLQSEFLVRLQSCSWQAGAEAQTRPTSQVGTNGWAGVREGKLIPFHAESSPS